MPLPAGYRRYPQTGKSFAAYLSNLQLKKDKTVYLYNGVPKANQLAQYAVLDISVGNKDLQQCADAVMRLRAEYLFAAKKYDAIKFNAGDGTWLSYTAWLNGTRYRLHGNKLVAIGAAAKPANNTHEILLNYLNVVFAYCGTATLPASLQPKPLAAIQPGDVFLKPGAPGHAVIVMDMATNDNGEKIYMLAQSYMPAQNIHILNNPAKLQLNPWYILNRDSVIRTPEWTFYRNQLYGWKQAG
ncbi:hypothetical protein A8C56_17355 [Niabella ginsenosidivorans]|uniref:DUF4846 domain-containing protein n=1 Tax=Niabella ginsenosidivorans TaxID=1176587 RepID=A0A1A9I9J0_9BACT|nr:hypothetical protein A8C56_17355 [Niabella ginsenosidivorans]